MNEFARKVNLNNGMYKTSIPKKIVDKLGIQASDEIIFKICGNGKILISKVKEENKNE